MSNFQPVKDKFLEAWSKLFWGAAALLNAFWLLILIFVKWLKVSKD